MLKRSALVVAATLFGVAIAAPSFAQVKGDANAGKEKIQMCQGCHGIEGYRTAYPEVFHVPRIGGQHEAYLLSALKAYKTGERNHPSMRAIAGSLSEQDMANLSAFYAQSQPGSRTTHGKK